MNAPTVTWYLATCHACTPVLPQPFADEQECDQWATAHRSGTGHVVTQAVEQRLVADRTGRAGNQPAGPRYETRGDQVVCLDCGSVIAEQAAHTRFHSILSGHAWALAVLRTSHIGAAAHDRYDVAERQDRRRFDSWTNDAFAEVTAQLGDPGE